MNELELLNEKISDENAQLNWVEYRTLAHESKLIEEKIEELMLKLDALDS